MWIDFFQHAYPLHKLENTEITAVCDIDPEALKIASELFHCTGYADYHELLRKEDLDVVHILTPHHLHAQMAIDAANSGKHILIEKPMAISMEDATAIVEAAQKNEITVGVMCQNRYNSASIAIKDALDNGSLGKVIGQRILLSWNKPDYYYEDSAWRGTWDQEGGSLLIDQAIHVLDLAR